MNRNKIPKWIIFDFYGVIAVDATIEAIIRRGDPKIDTEIRLLNKRKDLGELSLDSYILSLSKTLNITVERARWLENPADSFDPDIVQYIEHLRSQNYKIGIGSNSYEDSLHSAMQQAGLSGSVDAIISSSTIHAVKPDPKFWEAMIQVTGAAADEILFIDDRKENCQGAEQAGIQTILYSGFVAFCKDIESIIKPKTNA